MTLRSTLRFLLVAGVIGVAAGVNGAREWHVDSRMGEIGVIALLAAGFFAAITGAIGLLREQPSSDPEKAERDRILDRAAWRAMIPPVAGGGLMVAFFALTDRWDELDNPVASQVAVLCGIIGLLAGIVADRVTRWDLLLIPVALLIALIVWGDRLPLESETTSKGEMIALLSIVIILTGIAINIPQIARGRRRTSS